ncbi:MAG: Nitroreductase [Mycobacterium sp.]|jgi:nitroreductase|nr:Nitroreductase [Mycobacterium sp.]
MYDLDAVIRERRATRMFLAQQPVARESIDEALDLAIRAPSNSKHSAVAHGVRVRNGEGHLGCRTA